MSCTQSELATINNLKSLINALANAFTDQGTQSISLTGLITKVNGFEEDLLATASQSQVNQITTELTNIAAALGNKADGADLEALEADLGTLETALTTKANQVALDATNASLATLGDSLIEKASQQDLINLAGSLNLPQFKYDPVLYYNPSASGINGSTLPDLSASKNDATLYNGPAINNGGLEFVKASNHHSLTSFIALTAYTLIMNVKVLEDGTVYNVIANIGDQANASQDASGVGVLWDENRLAIWSGGVERYIAPANLGEFYTITIRAHSTNLKVDINGINVLDLAHSANVTNLSFGKQIGGGGNPCSMVLSKAALIPQFMNNSATREHEGLIAGSTTQEWREVTEAPITFEPGVFYYIAEDI